MTKREKKPDWGSEKFVKKNVKKNLIGVRKVWQKKSDWRSEKTWFLVRKRLPPKREKNLIWGSSKTWKKTWLKRDARLGPSRSHYPQAPAGAKWGEGGFATRPLRPQASHGPVADAALLDGHVSHHVFFPRCFGPVLWPLSQSGFFFPPDSKIRFFFMFPKQL